VYRRHLLLGGLALTAWPCIARAASAGTVNVAYAGSLVNLMEHGIGPAFDKTGGHFRGYAGGSDKMAHEISGKLLQGDVFISANPRVNDSLTGAAHGDWLDWYITFAQSPLVLGYNPQSRFADLFRKHPWYQVLSLQGIRIGRTDPKLDPKGRLTLALMKKAAEVYKIPDLEKTVLGPPENPAQVLPEETLVGRLQSGQLDVGFFYSTETADLKIPTVHLPQEVTLSAHYTAALLNRAPNPEGAADFLAFLLGSDGRAIMTAHGLDLVPPKLQGDRSQVPAKILALIP
jgi:molybdate/tungstate transport system substrate-binding protein